MTFRRGTPGNTFATFPTRNFSFLVDPTALPEVGATDNIGALLLVRDLGTLEWPVDVKLLWPTYIDNVSPGVSETLALLLGKHLQEVQDSGESRRFIADRHMAEAAREALGGESAGQRRRRSLLAVADDVQADGLVTADDVLVAQRYDLLQHHRIRVVPPVEFADVIEVCAHGHSIFWSASAPERRLTSDVYYQLHHWKQKRLASWYWAKRRDLEADLRDNVHSPNGTRANLQNSSPRFHCALRHRCPAFDPAPIADHSHGDETFTDTRDPAPGRTSLIRNDLLITNPGGSQTEHHQADLSARQIEDEL